MSTPTRTDDLTTTGAAEPAPSGNDAGVDTVELRRLIGGRWGDQRAAWAEHLAGLNWEFADDLTAAEQREVTLNQLLDVAATGDTLIGFPEAYGGKNDHGGSVALIEVLAQADLSLMVKAGVQWGLFGGALASLGTERHHAAYLNAMADGELLGCFAMTETGHGSDVQRIRTTATYNQDADEFVVHSPDPSARKDYIGNAAAHGRMAVVFAQLVVGGQSHGPHAVLVPIRDAEGNPMPGVTITDCGRKAGLNGVDNGRILFDHVRVPRTALLNRWGDVDADGQYTSPITSPGRRFFTMLGTLVKGRVSVAGCAGKATEKALTIAIRYGDTRRQFAPSDDAEETVLLDYPAYRRQLLPALARSYALHCAQEELLVDLHERLSSAEVDETAQRELESRAAGIKALATDHATTTVTACREACGGAGYLAENQLTRLRADLDVFTTFEGANTVLMQQSGKGLLTEYRQQIGDLDGMRMVAAVAEQVLSVVGEKTSARALKQRARTLRGRASDLAGMRDYTWHRELFADRAQHILQSLGMRIRAGAKAGQTGAELAARTQTHLLAAARAHLEHQILESFVRAISSVTDPALKKLLVSVCDLYVLSEIERDAAWFLEHGRLTTTQTKAARTSVDLLCTELRPHARMLADAFGVPEAWLTAPILTSPDGR